jgi:hypothetical protein
VGQDMVRSAQEGLTTVRTSMSRDNVFLSIR